MNLERAWAAVCAGSALLIVLVFGFRAHVNALVARAAIRHASLAALLIGLGLGLVQVPALGAWGALAGGAIGGAVVLGSRWWVRRVARTGGTESAS